MGIKVLFIYPNTFGMNMIPPAIALFSSLLKQRGHKTEIFDTTYYSMDHGIDSDGSKMENLNVCKPCKCGNYCPCIKNGDCRFCFWRAIEVKYKDRQR